MAGRWGAQWTSHWTPPMDWPLMPTRPPTTQLGESRIAQYQVQQTLHVAAECSPHLSLSLSHSLSLPLSFPQPTQCLVGSATVAVVDQAASLQEMKGMLSECLAAIGAPTEEHMTSLMQTVSGLQQSVDSLTTTLADKPHRCILQAPTEQMEIQQQIAPPPHRCILQAPTQQMQIQQQIAPQLTFHGAQQLPPPFTNNFHTNNGRSQLGVQPPDGMGMFWAGVAYSTGRFTERQQQSQHREWQWFNDMSLP